MTLQRLDPAEQEPRALDGAQIVNLLLALAVIGLGFALSVSPLLLLAGSLVAACFAPDKAPFERVARLLTGLVADGILDLFKGRQ